MLYNEYIPLILWSNLAVPLNEACRRCKRRGANRRDIGRGEASIDHEIGALQIVWNAIAERMAKLTVM